MNNNSKRKGNIGEAQALARLVSLGNPVATPFGDNERYDLVVESLNGKLLKAQIKYSSELSESGALSFYLRSSKNHTSHKGTYGYRNQVDIFLLYHTITNEVYVIESKNVNNQTRINLRISPTKNKQNKKVLFAKDFILNKAIWFLLPL